MSRNLFAIFGVFTLIGCGDAPVNLTVTAESSISIGFEINVAEEEQSLILDVLRTDVHVVMDPGTAHSSNAWITLEQEQRFVDLLTLEGIPSQIAGGAVPNGRLTGIRLVTSGGTYVVGTEEEPFTVPSGESSGLSLVIAPPVELGPDIEDITLSVRVEGLLDRQEHELKLRPALRLDPVQQ